MQCAKVKDYVQFLERKEERKKGRMEERKKERMQLFHLLVCVCVTLGKKTVALPFSVTEGKGTEGKRLNK